MKNKSLILLFLFMAMASMDLEAQFYTPCQNCDTIPSRYREYYYTQWYDECPLYATNGWLDDCHRLRFEFDKQNPPAAKWGYTDSPMQVKGIVALVDIYFCNMCFYDTIKMPEYVYIYQKVGDSAYLINPPGLDSSYWHYQTFTRLDLIDSARWDTAKPHYMEFLQGETGEVLGYCYAFEAYFDHPVTVDSSFYLLGSWNSTKRSSPEALCLDYIPTCYVGVESEPLVITIQKPGCQPYDDLQGDPRCWPTGQPDLFHMGMETYEWMAPSIPQMRTFGCYLPIVDQNDLNVNSDNLEMGSVSGGGRYPTGHTRTISATPNTGYYFQEWNDGNTENPRTITLDRDTTFTAYFYGSGPTMYAVTAVPNNSAWGSVSGGGNYPENTDVVLTAVPEQGSVFDHWNDGCQQSVRTITVTSDTLFIAFFRQLQVYTVTVDANNREWGSVSGGGDYLENSEVELSAEPESFAVFEQWSDGDQQSVRTITVTSDTLFTAFFRQLQVYTVTADANNPEWGSVSGGGDYLENSEVELSAEPESFAVFEQWSDGDQQSVRTITVTSDTAFTAIFSLVDPEGIVDSDKSGVEIVPNPAKDNLIIRMGDAGNYKIEVYDASGRNVKRTSFNGQETELDVSALASGHYLIKVIGSDRVVIRNFVISK